MMTVLAFGVVAAVLGAAVGLGALGVPWRDRIGVLLIVLGGTLMVVAGWLDLWLTATGGGVVLLAGAVVYGQNRDRFAPRHEPRRIRSAVPGTPAEKLLRQTEVDDIEEDRIRTR